MTTRTTHRADTLSTVKSQTAEVVRSNPPTCTQYLDYRAYLRRDFWYACAYCTLAECEAAGVGFEIDHYLPQHRYPELGDDYTNLFWSCSHCNKLKGDYPTEAAARKGYRFYRPDMDDPRDHFIMSELSPTRIEAKSEQ